MVLLDETSTTRKTRSAAATNVRRLRDRLSVDKDAPELIRAKSISSTTKRMISTTRSESGSDPRVRLRSRRARRLSARAVAGPFVRALGEQTPGDPSLFDPDEIQRALETPVAYAKHVMMFGGGLSAIDRAHSHRSGGISRADVRWATRDRNFGRLALKEFGPSSGFWILSARGRRSRARDPPRISAQGRLRASLSRTCRKPKKRAADDRHEDAADSRISDELKIRGFAVSGGGRPGYVFERSSSRKISASIIQSPGDLPY